MHAIPFVDLKRLHAPARDELLAAFARILDSGAYVQGPELAALERECAAAFGVTHALGVANGTAALQLALMSMDIGPGDEVITVSNTFIATAEAISAVGATPVFCDIVEGGFTMDPDDLVLRITPRTRAVIPVHLYGELADMPRIMGIARRHGLRVIEDACQAHGASLDGQPAGTFGDAGVFSFYPTKNLGTVGEGGMVLTSDPETARTVVSLRDHGQSSRHAHDVPGFNLRLSELQAAAVRVFLPHLPAWNELRRGAAADYRRGLAGSHVVAPVEAGPSHVYHLFVVRSPQRDALKAHLEAQGIATALHYPRPIHLQAAYASAGFGPGSLPRTEAAVAEILSLPMHPLIRPDEIDAVCSAIQAFDRTNRGTTRELQEALV